MRGSSVYGSPGSATRQGRQFSSSLTVRLQRAAKLLTLRLLLLGRPRVDIAQDRNRRAHPRRARRRGRESREPLDAFVDELEVVRDEALAGDVVLVEAPAGLAYVEGADGLARWQPLQARAPPTSITKQLPTSRCAATLRK